MAALTVEYTKEQVEDAMEEFREIGREGMIERYGGAPAESYFVEDNREYDLLLIHRAACTAAGVSSGESSTQVIPRMLKLGFCVRWRGDGQ